MRSVALALLVTACIASEPPPPPPAPVVRAHEAMPEHVAQLDAASRALIDSDVPAAVQALRWIGEHPVAADTLAPYAGARLAAIRDAARAGVAAGDRKGVAAAVGRIAVECGACHARAEIGPRPRPVPAPRAGGLQGTMRRYAWAADRMLQGLVTDDHGTWSEGARVVFAEPLTGVRRVDGTPAPAEVDAFITRMSELSLDGVQPTGRTERGALYAELVATCGACHAATGGGPAAAAARAQHRADTDTDTD